MTPNKNSSSISMNRFRMFLATAVLLSLAGPLHAQSVTNGTLDTDATGWLFNSACGDAVWDGGAGNPPGAIRLNSCGEPNSDPTAAQTVNGLTIGNTYTIHVDVQLHANSSGGGTGKTFGVFLDGEPANPLLLTEFLDGSWHSVAVPFTATATSHTIIFAAELDGRTPGGPGIATDVSYYIDNISLAPVMSVPMMSNHALVALALLIAAIGLAALRRPSRLPS